MAKEERAAKFSPKKERNSSLDLPLDLNLLDLPLQQSKNTTKQNHLHDTFDNCSRQFSSSRSDTRKENRATKLGYSKSFKFPSPDPISNELHKEKARRTKSTPDSLNVPFYGLAKFSFEKPLYEHKKRTFYDVTENHDALDKNLHLGLKLPVIRVHSTHCQKHELYNRNKSTQSTAGKDFHLPYVKNKKFNGL